MMAVGPAVVRRQVAFFNLSAQAKTGRDFAWTTVNGQTSTEFSSPLTFLASLIIRNSIMGSGPETSLPFITSTLQAELIPTDRGQPLLISGPTSFCFSRTIIFTTQITTSPVSLTDTRGAGMWFGIPPFITNRSRLTDLTREAIPVAAHGR